MYQDLLHVTKEELKQQQKENTELMEQSAVKEAQLQQQVSAVRRGLTTVHTTTECLNA